LERPFRGRSDPCRKSQRPERLTEFCVPLLPKLRPIAKHLVKCYIFT
jgi:hypothetical protein